MATIRTAIELNDNFSSVLNNIVNAMNMTVSVVEQMQGVVGEPIDTAAFEGIRDYADRATMAVMELTDAMQSVEPPEMPEIPELAQISPVPVEIPALAQESFEPVNIPVQIQEPLDPVDIPVQIQELPEAVEIPVQWQTDSLEVFTNSGIERFELEIQSANSMLDALNQNQIQIAETAAQTNIFPPNMAADMNGMQARLQAIQQRILTIENNPINMGTDIANNELERLRAQLDQAVQQQGMLNQAVEGMDIQAANQAYLQLSQTVGNTERYIRDNVDEQGQFNRAIESGTESADDLQKMISKAVGTFASIAGLKKVFSFITDCTEAFDTQLNAETQLMSVLSNSLDTDYISQFEAETTVNTAFEIETIADTSTAVDEINAVQSNVDEVTISVSAETQAMNAAFEQITEKAAEIQSRGIYGDEVMIAAGAEFATYFSDTDAIEMMMDTLTDYAMGMTGGGEVGSEAMVNYATNLGKIMSGSYDAMTKKGFELSDTQKAIIEGTATQEQIVSALGSEYLAMSQDMQAAAAISQVVEESWSGLYENMSNTPQGKIIQMTNAWGDLTETIGGQLYPYIILFVDAITSNWDTIETIVQGATTGLQFLLGILSWIFNGVMAVANGFINNWGTISPILTPIITAIALLAAGMLVYKVATTLAAFATGLLESGLLIVLAVIFLVVAAIFFVVNVINKATGSSVSAIGVIVGALAVAGAFVWDLFLGLLDLVLGIINYWVNPIIAFVNFFGNVFNDPIGSIIHLFGDLADNVLGVIQKIASALDFVFGSNMADTVQSWRDGLSEMVDTAAKEYGNGQYAEIISSMDLSVEGLGLSRIAYSDAWEAGYNLGESIESFDPSSLFGTTDIPTPEDLVASGIGGSLEDISENTGDIADSVTISEEDLKYLRDIAEQETINRFTTAEITVEQHNTNNISSKMDIDGVIDGLTDATAEAMYIIAEGVHV